MAGRNQHVVPHEGKWAVQSEGSKKVTSVFDTKSKAIDAAREIASREGADYFVQGNTGQTFFRSKVPSRINEEVIRSAVRELSGKTPASRQRRSQVEVPSGIERRK